MNRSSKRVVFNYPSRGIGGAQLLFCRIAVGLHLKGYRIANVDSGESFISTYLIDNGIPFEHLIASEDNKANLLKDDILVLSLSYIFIFTKIIKLHGETKILFWDLHPYNLIEQTALSYLYKKNNFFYNNKSLRFLERNRIRKIKEIVDSAHQKESVFFMCKKNFLYSSNFFNLSFIPSYIPIPISFNKKPVYDLNNRHKKEIHIGWISRLDPDKVGILNVFISDISDYVKNNPDIKLYLHVIGCGASEDKIDCLPDQVVRFTGRLEGNALDNYLRDNIDIGFSMGTSALEFAARAIPTVLVPSPTLRNFFMKVERRYLFLNKAKGYDVAVEEYYDEEERNTFAEILLSLKISDARLACESYEYAYASHAIDKVTTLLSSKIQSSGLLYKDFETLVMSKGANLEGVLLYFKSLVKRIVKK